MTLASQTSLQEVNETRQKIEESLQELAAHKAKRLQARNEMVALAKALERAQQEGAEVRASYHIQATVFLQSKKILRYAIDSFVRSMLRMHVGLW